jgi:hypothetical protein
MKPISNGYIETSATFSLPRKKWYWVPISEVIHQPVVGDVIYGKIDEIKQHNRLENKVGRIHYIHDNTKALFVLGNRYAADYYEAIMPLQIGSKIDLVSRSGLVAKVNKKNASIKDPTQVKVIGYVCDQDGNIVNTINYKKNKNKTKTKTKSKLILSLGTNMNSGKTTTAAMCCWTLSKAGHYVTASKITGTASLKDILFMQDSGASKILDFSYFGYPSTYMMNYDEMDSMFLEFEALNSKGYWVVELADGILQRETSYLLENKYFRSRISKIIFSANDSFSAISGLEILKDKFSYKVDAVSGVVSGSPLMIEELDKYTDIPVINNIDSSSFKSWLEILV